MTSPVGFIKITNVQKFGEHQHPQTNIIIIHKNTDVHKCIIILLSDNDKISPTIKWLKKKKKKKKATKNDGRTKFPAKITTGKTMAGLNTVPEQLFSSSENVH